ncbi:hypothetical protein [Candidatus Uabimicrobium sp. HlEnr_7]|uniref:hypothetical protein n=1 Tax=Candidatus Uabimicrobium helgolandensis TaxID=3095367 RepID=UPI00355601C3
MWKTTSWSEILKIQKNDTEIKNICESYWGSVYAFLRYKGYSVEDAQDYAQSFFIKFLENKWILLANREKGKFRTLLLTLLTRFVKDQNMLSQKQFEKKIIHPDISIIHTFNLEDNNTPEKSFHRNWAYSLIEIVLLQFKKQTKAENNIIEYIVLWLYFFSDSLQLQMGDIIYPNEFMRKLCNKSNSFTYTLVQQFSPKIVKLLENHSIEQYASSQLQKMVIHEINTIFKTPIYRKIQHIEFLSTNHSKNNRHALEHFFNHEIIKSINSEEQISFNQIAHHLNTSKSTINRIMKKAKERYRHLLLMEVRRYTEDDKIENEISELLKML